MTQPSPGTYRMVVAYDGSRYHGWQAQPGVATVEGELSRALAELTSEHPSIRAAGRTDAGAHAHGQVVSFTLSSEWRPDRLLGACNARLPEDIGVLDAELVGADFHPRWQAWRRTYRYLVRRSDEAGPVGRQYEWRVGGSLELAPMREAARLLLGSHDFGAFGRSPLSGGSTVRTVDRAELERHSELITLEVRADAFLRGMMRNLAGALVAVGQGRMAVAAVAGALAAGAPVGGSWRMAPAHGLHQWQVEYRPLAKEVSR